MKEGKNDSGKEEVKALKMKKLFSTGNLLLSHTHLDASYFSVVKTS